MIDKEEFEERFNKKFQDRLMKITKATEDVNELFNKEFAWAKNGIDEYSPIGEYGDLYGLFSFLHKEIISLNDFIEGYKCAKFGVINND